MDFNFGGGGGGWGAAATALNPVGVFGTMAGGGMDALGNWRQAKRQGQGMDRAIDYLQGPSYTEFGEKSPQQLEMERMSRQQYLDQAGMLQGMDQEFSRRQGLASQAQGTAGSIMGGGAFNLTPQEQARIEDYRQANIGASQQAVQGMLDQNLGQLSADMGRRGVRGQAASQLQAGALDTAANQLNRATLEANRTAAQQQMAMPSQRVSQQGAMAGQMAGFGDQLQQRAFQNRQMLQNPAMLRQMQAERQAQAMKYGPNAQAANFMFDRASLDPEMGAWQGLQGGMGNMMGYMAGGMGGGFFG